MQNWWLIKHIFHKKMYPHILDSKVFCHCRVRPLIQISSPVQHDIHYSHRQNSRNHQPGGLFPLCREVKKNKQTKQFNVRKTQRHFISIWHASNSWIWYWKIKIGKKQTNKNLIERHFAPDPAPPTFVQQGVAQGLVCGASLSFGLLTSQLLHRSPWSCASSCAFSLLLKPKLKTKRWCGPTFVSWHNSKVKNGAVSGFCQCWRGHNQNENVSIELQWKLTKLPQFLGCFLPTKGNEKWTPKCLNLSQ